MNRQFSYNWIKEYVKLPVSAKEFAREFSLKSQTVEKIIPVKPVFKKVVAAKIIEIAKHPNADKLQLATVDTGKKQLTVVCGAPNIAVGQVVPLALEGAKVLDSHQAGKSFILKKVDIRGIKSVGML